MDKKDIPFLSTAELGRLIEQKQVSPVEATDAYLDRIDDLDFKFNSYLTICRKQALQAAKDAEQSIVQGNYLGPMHGIPVAVKDQIWTEGIRTTGGSRILVDFVPEEDATVVANLKKAGSVILGKTNMNEFALMANSHRYTTPRNPWNLDMYTGGSSGGSGAATSAFLCSTSLGEDTGGSIRFPAGWCGLVGLRPGWGRVSRFGIMKGVWSMDTAGPISRTVEDAAITLGAIAGQDPKDPYSWKTPVPDYRRSLTGDISGIRVGIINYQLDSDLVEPEVRQAFLRATSVLGDLGASVEEVSVPLIESAAVATSVILLAEPAINHHDWIRHRFQDYGHDNRIGLSMGSIIPAQAYYKAQKLRSMLSEQIYGLFESYDVLVTPTMGTEAMEIRDDVVITSKEMAAKMPYVVRRIFNLASVPALTVPCGFGARGLPVGLQIGGRAGEEETVLKVGHAYEQNTPWHTMRPPNA